MAKQKLVLFDIDYTLFDTAVYREQLFPALLQHLRVDNAKAKEILQDIYYSHRKHVGHFDLAIIIEELIEALSLEADAEEVFQEFLYAEQTYAPALYEEAKDTLQKLSELKDLRIGIFSGGRTDHQLQKINSLEKFFHKEHVHIFLVKEKEIEKVMKKYVNYQLFLVDDVLDILHNAKKANPDVTTVWSKRGRLAERVKEIPGFTPDYTITNLEEVVKILKKY